MVLFAEGVVQGGEDIVGVCAECANGHLDSSVEPGEHRTIGDNSLRYRVIRGSSDKREVNRNGCWGGRGGSAFMRIRYEEDM